MTEIQHYEFGKVVVDSKVYTSDIKIIKGKVIANWWRTEGHNLYLKDIQDVLNSSPNIIIIGCGANSTMEVSKEVKEYCKNKNITLYISNSYEAIKLFNQLAKKDKESVALCLHLTC